MYCTKGLKGREAGGGDRDKLLSPIKSFQWHASQIASYDWLSNSWPSRGETVFTNRRGQGRITGALKPAASGRWTLSALEGSSSRGRKTLISNLRCLAAIPNPGKGSKKSL